MSVDEILRSIKRESAWRPAESPGNEENSDETHGSSRHANTPTAGRRDQNSPGQLESSSDETVPRSFVNSLGHRLVRIPETQALFSVWPVRVADYQAFVFETGRSWKAAGFPQNPNHPAVRISYHDAGDFCRWLTQRERQSNKLPPGFEYRLPRDLEWSAAAGISEKSEGPPAWRSGAIPDCFPWGDSWPPPPGSGNYDGRLKADAYAYTSPVGSFAPNKLGLYDMSGNVFEWVADDFDESGLGCLRGGSWPDESPVNLNLSTRCQDNKTTAHKCYGFRFVLAPVGSGVH
ncbi:MAG: SUMF1/EgtB/PvdO family nonheme iron enzyme [Chthoniobacterales bacterium]|nr:SUMF1/EgtB/PvdO family nonheme iron enzyme [Chthoniobacterales bacterium]